MGFKPGQVITDAALNARDMTGQAVFIATRSSTQSLANATVTAISLSTPTLDTLGAYSAGNPSRFTPTVAGYYAITGTMGFAANTTGVRIIEVALNGTAVAAQQFSTASAGDARFPLPPAIIYMNGTTDYLEIRGYQNSGGALNTITGAGAPTINVTYAGA